MKTIRSIKLLLALGATLAVQCALAGANPHSSAAPAAPVKEVRVDKASGADARTVAEIVANAASLKDKVVRVRGQVVKYHADIMGRNWVHLHDGTGTAAAGTNDLLVTTHDATRPGDIVTAKGVVHVDKDFGAGYVYKVLIEDAALLKE